MAARCVPLLYCLRVVLSIGNLCLLDIGDRIRDRAKSCAIATLLLGSMLLERIYEVSIPEEERLLHGGVAAVVL